MVGCATVYHSVKGSDEHSIQNVRNKRPRRLRGEEILTQKKSNNKKRIS
jgi:hypothetical protein